MCMVDVHNYSPRLRLCSNFIFSPILLQFFANICNIWVSGFLYPKAPLGYPTLKLGLIRKGNNDETDKG